MVYYVGSSTISTLAPLPRLINLNKHNAIHENITKPTITHNAINNSVPAAADCSTQTAAF